MYKNKTFQPGLITNVVDFHRIYQPGKRLTWDRAISRMKTEANSTYLIVLREEKVKNSNYRKCKCTGQFLQAINVNTQHEAFYNYLFLSQIIDNQCHLNSR